MYKCRPMGIMKYKLCGCACMLYKSACSLLCVVCVVGLGLCVHVPSGWVSGVLVSVGPTCVV